MNTLLFTSVGSLVGQNLSDCLDGRHQGLRVRGSNSFDGRLGADGVDSA